MTCTLPKEMPEKRSLSGTVSTSMTFPAPQTRKLSGTALTTLQVTRGQEELRQDLQSGTVPERKFSALHDQKEALARIEAFMRQENITEDSNIRTIPDNFDVQENEEVVFISEDSYGVVTGEDTTDSVCDRMILFKRKTTAKNEDSLNFVVRKRLLGGTGRKQSENLQGGTVDERLSFDLKNILLNTRKKKQLTIKHQSQENHEVQESQNRQEKRRK